jgi:hypothetical protein
MKTCFVIQPFDAGKFDKRYEDVFVPAVKQRVWKLTGLTVIQKSAYLLRISKPDRNRNSFAWLIFRLTIRTFGLNLALPLL